MIVKPETLIGWHRRGFKLFWKWKSRVGRPRLPEKFRKLITRMALENPAWGQARVAAELSLKLGIYVSPRTVRAYWPPESGPRGPHRTSSQHWKMFVRNHAQSIVACDFLVVITARFRTLYVSLAKSLSELESVRSHCVCGLTYSLGEIKLESGRAGGGILKCAYTRLLSSRLTQTTGLSSAFVAMMQTAEAWELRGCREYNYQSNR